jgi:ABC-type branched-subunit amino acid transport system substrate-binding protein
VRQHTQPNLKSQTWLKCLFLFLYLAFCVSFSGAGLATAPAQNPLTPNESRGKQIYTRGTSPSGKDILAYFGESSIEVQGSAMPCANCHGLNGQGKPEGGVSPSNLTWEALSKPYGVKHEDGRQHPPYTERGLELAITRGIDPASNKLLNVMPRYVMSKEDLADLILYLKRLGKDRDPGINETTIVIGTTIPNGALAEMGQAVKAVTTAFFDEVNSLGGIYSRRLELKLIETSETPAAKRASIERLLTDEQVFAISGAFIVGAEQEIIPLMAQNEVPLIGPITLYPQTGLPLNRQVFYILSGIDGQARALMDFVAKKPEIKVTDAAVVYPRSEINESVVKAIADQSRKNGWSTPQVFGYTTGGMDVSEIIKQVRKAGSEVVFFLGNSAEALSFMKAADQLSWYPVILQPGSGSTAIFNAPMGFNGKLFASVPTSPVDQTAKGMKEFVALAEKYKLPEKHLAVQFSAYSAARILVEALKRVGRDISREKLIQALEGFNQYSTELTPAITYSPNRRIGAMGAYVLQIDLKDKRLLPAGGWIEIK